MEGEREGGKEGRKEEKAAKSFFSPCPHVLFIFLCSMGKYNLLVADTLSFYVVFSKIRPAGKGMSILGRVEMQP